MAILLVHRVDDLVEHVGAIFFCVSGTGVIRRASDRIWPDGLLVDCLQPSRCLDGVLNRFLIELQVDVVFSALVILIQVLVHKLINRMRLVRVLWGAALIKLDRLPPVLQSSGWIAEARELIVWRRLGHAEGLVVVMG